MGDEATDALKYEGGFDGIVSWGEWKVLADTFEHALMGYVVQHSDHSRAKK